MNADVKKIDIEIIYALPHEQNLLRLQVEKKTTIEQAIKISNLLKKHPEIDLNVNQVGIFSQKAKLDTILEQGDRIEIYRPLLIDPKEARKNRAKKVKLNDK